MTESINGPRVKPGEELVTSFLSVITKKELFQLDYRTPNGILFSCVAKSPEECRTKRDEWLAKQSVPVT